VIVRYTLLCSVVAACLLFFLFAVKSCCLMNKDIYNDVKAPRNGLFQVELDPIRDSVVRDIQTSFYLNASFVEACPNTMKMLLDYIENRCPSLVLRTINDMFICCGKSDGSTTCGFCLQ